MRTLILLGTVLPLALSSTTALSAGAPTSSTPDYEYAPLIPDDYSTTVDTSSSSSDTIDSTSSSASSSTVDSSSSSSSSTIDSTSSSSPSIVDSPSSYSSGTTSASGTTETSSGTTSSTGTPMASSCNGCTDYKWKGTVNTTTFQPYHDKVAPGDYEPMSNLGGMSAEAMKDTDNKYKGTAFTMKNNEFVAQGKEITKTEYKPIPATRNDDSIKSVISSFNR